MQDLGLGLGAPEREGAALAALRRSVLIETGVGLAVLALVAWLGTLAPRQWRPLTEQEITYLKSHL